MAEWLNPQLRYVHLHFQAVGIRAAAADIAGALDVLAVLPRRRNEFLACRGRGGLRGLGNDEDAPDHRHQGERDERQTLFEAHVSLLSSRTAADATSVSEVSRNPSLVCPQSVL